MAENLGFVPADAFARATGVSVRAAQKALTRAYANIPWNGHLLDVRVVPTRGGASGIRYEVAVASLPPEIASRVAPSPAAPLPAQHRLPMGADFRLALVQSICEAGPPGSEARAVQLRAVAARALYPSGKKAGQRVAERTLRAWVAAHDRAGALPLIRRKPRADRGASRVIAWREWDRAMVAAGVPEAKQRQMAATMDAEVRGLWAAGEVSAANIQFSMSVRCRALAEAAGLVLPEAEMAALCRMPQHFAGQKDRRRARMAHVKRTDAARYASHHVPRVRRHRNGLRPMDLVAVDVRHSDILYRRPDGSLATPKIIAFLDLATNRLFARPFLLPKGEMIRREHVLVALRDLAADPAWGLWRGLYLDNGGEFQLGAAPEDLTRLVGMVRAAFSAHDGEVSAECGNITSRPYNPQSKVIESIFSAFTRSVEPIYQGFIGGNRMAKKTQNQGRAPVPMAGDEATILARFAEMVAFYNAKPQQRGHIKGRSPNEAFAAFALDAAPWGAVTLDPGEFALAFGPDETRVVQPGGELHIRGRMLAHPELSPDVGKKVRVRLPILDPTRAVVLSDKGEPLLVVAEAVATGMQDRAGVKTHDRGRREAGAAFAKAAAGAAKMDPMAARNAAVAAMPKLPAPAPVANVSVHPVLREAATGQPVRAILPRAAAKRRADADAQEAALAQVIAGFRRAG
jgi:hypothetical protein